MKKNLKIIAAVFINCFLLLATIPSISAYDTTNDVLDPVNSEEGYYDNWVPSWFSESYFDAIATIFGTYENLALAIGSKSQGMPVQDNDTAEVIDPCEPGIEIEKYVRNGSGWADTTDVMLGDTVSFKAVIYNPSDCYIIHFSGVVFDYLPDNLMYDEGSSTIYPEGYPNSEYYDLVNNTVYWGRPPSIMPNENLTFYYNATAVGCGLGVNNLTAHPEGFTLVDDYLEENASNVNRSFCDNETTLANLTDENDYPMEVSNADGSYDVSDSASVKVICEPCEPGISIEKWVWNGSGWADTTDVMLGDTVSFKAVIYNPSNCYIIGFSGTVFDQLPSNLRYVNGSSTIYPEGYLPPDAENPEVVDWENNTVTWYKVPDIMPGDNLTFYYNATAVDCRLGVNDLTAHPTIFSPVDPGEPVSNADGSYDYPVEPIYSDDGSYDVSDYATVNVECPHDVPDLTLEKYVKWDCSTPFVKSVDAVIGDYVVFKLFVNNTGDTLLDIVVVDELPLGLIYGNDADSTPSSVVGNTITWRFDGVKPGNSIVITFSATVDECGELINNANATGIYGEQTIYRVDTASVNVICEPEISIDKRVDFDGDYNYTDLETNYAEETAYWKVVVTNFGNTPVYNIVVTDSNGYDFGDPFDLLNYGDYEEFIYPMVINEDTTNEACAQGVDELGGIVDAGCDSAEVQVINPQICIDKRVDFDGDGVYGELEMNYPGETAHWKIVVTNTGDSPVYNIYVTDDNGQSYGPFDLLANGDSQTFDYDTNPTADFTNDACAKGVDELGTTVGPVCDPASVDVNECPPPIIDIDVEKSVKKNCNGTISPEGIYIESGDPVDWVTFILYVTNTGDVPLNVTVVDTLPDGLSYINTSYHGNTPPNSTEGNKKLIWNIGIVDRNVTVALNFRARIGDQVCGELNNTVNVSGVYDDQHRYAEDYAYVFVLCPGIDIVKEANPTMIHSGDLVTYTYEVSNIGNTALTNVVVTDDKISVVSYVSGDTNHDGWLDLDEIWIYEATANPTEDVCNNGTVTAKDKLGVQVSDEDDAFVDVIEGGPKISIDKLIWDGKNWVDELYVNDYPMQVHFKIIVRNTGTRDLVDIIIEDILGCGIDDPDCFSEGIDYEIKDDHIYWKINGPFTPSSDPIAINFSATAYQDANNSVFVKANSTYDGTQVTADDKVFITYQDIKPTVKITSPVPASIYFRNRRIPRLLSEKVFIVGGINITAEASDEDGEITNVEFFIDNEFKYKDTEAPFYWNWNEKAFGRHEIKVKAYDNNGNTAEEKIEIFIINLGLKK